MKNNPTIIFLLLSGYLTITVHTQPVLFPHGWFESKNLRPRDAIILNMMAQSNLEYGGVTLEELDKLDAVRKLIPRPTDLARDREEDDPELDREPVVSAPSDADGKMPKDGEVKLKKEDGAKKDDNPKKEEVAKKDETAKKDDSAKKDINPKKSPFHRVNLKLNRKRETKNEDTEIERKVEAGNPFEEIATRSPPRDYMYMRQLRNRNRKNKKKRRRYRKNGFLTRDDIIKPKPKPTPSSVTLNDKTSEKAEFDHTRRNIAQETWEREAKVAEQIRNDMARGVKEEKEPEPISPALKLLEKEDAERNGKINTLGTNLSSKIQRLPNNPFLNVDIRKPTVLELPTPPPEDFSTK